MTGIKRNPRPTIGVLAGWQFYEGNVNGFLDLVLRGIHSAAQQQNCNLLFACGMGHAIGPIRLRPAWPEVSPEVDFVPVGPWNTDGLIVINPLLSVDRVDYIQRVRKEGYPVVFVGPAEGTAVVPDNESGIRQAISHLVKHGHRRIAFIAGHQGEADDDSRERLQAYQAALQEFGLEEDPKLVAYGSHSFQGGQQAMKRLLGSGESCRAVLASNDYSAMGAMFTLREAGLRIPEDIAVVGFDDLPEVSGQEPSLTTVHYPSINAGREALALLLEIINGHCSKDRTVPVPVHLVVRESCGCQPGDSIAVVSPAKHGIPVITRLSSQMSEIIRVETKCLNPEEIEAFCGDLVNAFVHSLEESEPAIFSVVFRGILHRMEELRDDPVVLHTALSLLEMDGAGLVANWDDPSSRQAEAMLNQARQAISISLRKQKVEYISDRGNIADQIGLLNSQLFTAVDDKEIFGMMREFLPKVGIERADVAFYEADGEDIVASSRLYSSASLYEKPICFPSREFPPEGLYPQDKPFSLAVVPLLSQGGVDGFVAFDSLDLTTCVTVVRQLMAAFRGVRLYREAIEGRRLAEQSRKLAEDADRMKSRFLSTVSHELRTPLNLIVGLSNLVLQDDSPGETPLSDSRREDLEQIHRNAEHLGRLIRDVLDLATSQAGQLRLQMEQLDLMETFKAALEAGEELARQKGLEWKVSLPKERPMVMGDRTRLSQVLLNLVSNAVKFTERGRIEVRIEAHMTEAQVSVQDTGLGIPPGEQAIIFDEFRQSERTTARGYGGMGLGLAISRRLVELHGGKIGVQSSGQEGSGSTFHFTIPILHPQEEELPAPDQERFVALLVAERSTDGKQLENHLASQGFPVRTFRAEQTAWLKQVLAASPAAVVLDASLAPKRGWEIMRELKANPSTHDVPVLFYSLAQSGGSILELDYLTKPVDSPELVRTLARQGLDERAFSEGSKTILIVDDEPGILEMHARVVRSQYPSCNILRAHNGREALESIQQECPDLVLLDLMMPELDGFGVLKAMRSGEHTRDIPVIVLTAQALTEEDMTRLNQGVAAVLQKGIFSPGETFAHIEAALARLPRLNSEMQNIIRRSMAYIHGHYAEAISRKTLALYVGVSERYLTRCFHQELGITPVEYLNRHRMKQARLMLEAGKSVTDTALEAGFSSLSYFTKFFHSEVGMLPSAYRQVHLKK